MIFPESCLFYGSQTYPASYFILQLRSGHLSWLLVIFLHSHTPTHVLGPCVSIQSLLLTHLALFLISTCLSYLMTEKNRPLQNNTGRMTIFIRNFIESKTKIKKSLPSPEMEKLLFWGVIIENQYVLFSLTHSMTTYYLKELIRHC